MHTEQVRLAGICMCVCMQTEMCVGIKNNQEIQNNLKPGSHTLFQIPDYMQVTSTQVSWPLSQSLCCIQTVKLIIPWICTYLVEKCFIISDFTLSVVETCQNAEYLSSVNNDVTRMVCMEQRYSSLKITHKYTQLYPQNSLQLSMSSAYIYNFLKFTSSKWQYSSKSRTLKFPVNIQYPYSTYD